MRDNETGAPTNYEIKLVADRIERMVGYDGSLYTHQEKYHSDLVGWHVARRDDCKKFLDSLANLTTTMDLLINGYKPSGRMADGKVIYEKYSPALTDEDGFSLEDYKGAVKELAAEVLKLGKRVRGLSEDTEDIVSTDEVVAAISAAVTPLDERLRVLEGKHSAKREDLRLPSEEPPEAEAKNG